MRNKKISLLSLTLFLILILSMTPVSEATTVEELLEELMCTCGCGKTLANCDCKIAKEMKSEVQERLDRGETKEQVLSYFHATYGDIVLATPPKSGLELFLWTFPIIAAILGTVVIYQLARRKAPYTSKVRAPTAEPKGERS